MHHISKTTRDIRKKQPALRENGDNTFASCISVDISHLNKKSKRCSKLEVVHAISVKNLLARWEGINAKKKT